MTNVWKSLLVAALAAYGVSGSACAEEPQATPLPTAVLPFTEHGAGVNGMGVKVSDLLFASLATQDDLWLVERQEVDKVLSEHELSASGMVNPAQAVQVGAMVGAKVLVSGSVMEVDKNLVLVAKLIGTETTRVLGVTVSGPARGDLSPLASELATKAVETLRQKGSVLLAKVEKREDRVAGMNRVMGEKRRPSLTIHVSEQHVGQATMDPAAQTEVVAFAKDTGFTVLEAGAAQTADVVLEGEGFSEFGLRRGNLVSVKARVELKAVDRKSGEVLATDREVAVEVDIAEQVAGKKALQACAARIVERLLPKLVK